MLTLFSSPEAWISLFTLTALEVVLGIDNLVFVSLMAESLPSAQQRAARQFGLALACITRLLLLAAVTWMLHFTQPLFTLANRVFSGRDLLLILGGVFLLSKGTTELHHNIYPYVEQNSKQRRCAQFSLIMIQIMFLDIIFSLDSVITAVGMASEFITMALAIVIAISLMIWASEAVSRFITRYPSLKILGLSFLLLVGLTLLSDGFGFHIPRGYLYFAIAFSVFVEWLNIAGSRWRGRRYGEGT